MVKALIQGLMGRRSSDEEKEVSEKEIPDELPPLVEDAAKEEQEKVRLEIEEKAKKEKEEQEELKEDAPEELTPIDEEIIKEEPKETEEIDKLKEESNYGFEEKGAGFFSNLLNITKNQGLNKKLLNKDLYQGMKNYYSLKPSVDVKPITKKELEDDVTTKLDELKLLEKDWQKQKEFVEKNGGTINIYSQLNKGTTIEFTLKKHFI